MEAMTEYAQVNTVLSVLLILGGGGGWASQYCTCLHSSSLHAQYSRLQFAFTDSTSAVIIWSKVGVYLIPPELSCWKLEFLKWVLIPELSCLVVIPTSGIACALNRHHAEWDSRWPHHHFIIVWRYWLKVNRLCSLLKNIFWLTCHLVEYIYIRYISVVES